MVTNKPKKYFFRDYYTLRLCACAECIGSKSSDLLEFNQTHNAAMFSFNCEAFALQIYHT